MTTTQPTEAGHHAFTAAVAARDIDALVGTLAPDAVLHSPITNTPSKAVRCWPTCTEACSSPSRSCASWTSSRTATPTPSSGRAASRAAYVAGADRFRVDAPARCATSRSIGRPLTGLAGFLTGVGFRFARRRRGPVVARILRVTALPLAPMFSLVDWIVSWLIRGSGGSGR